MYALQAMNSSDLFLPAQLRELDRLAAARAEVGGSLTLMERAGAAAYRRLRERWPDARRVVVMAGVGNNAGDGYVVARLARADGLAAEVVQVGDGPPGRGDAATVRERYRQAGGQVRGLDPAALADSDVIVDALFGIGVSRPLEGVWAAAVRAINAAARPVLALDLPSGLDASSGNVLGVAVRAELTVTFIGQKPGLFISAGRCLAGEVILEDLGVPAAVYEQVAPAARLITPAEVAEQLPPRAADAHKGDYGHVLVVGGGRGMGGAVRMAAEAALRVGAGLVTVATLPEHCLPLLAARPEAMVVAATDAAGLQPLLERATVIVLGPGLGRDDWGRSMFEAAMGASQPLILDADALNLLALEGRRRDDWILTPHPGEAGRLLGISSREVQQDRFGAVAAIQRRYGGIAVLKGAGTLINAGSGPSWLCGAGNPGMASGGMGDVLSGVIGGLLAQGLAPAAAARIGVQVHAAAGDAAAQSGERGLLATDLMPHLRQLVNPT